MERYAKLIAYGVLLLITSASIELLSYVFCEYFVMKKAGFLLYTPPHIEAAALERYYENRDPVLGWPTKGILRSDRHDSSGSRPVPAFPSPGQECVTIYGDSFTYGSDVSDEEAWGNLLAAELDCRVGNFGVAGYGTDQAVLRLQSKEIDTAEVSILGIFPHDIMRNVNRYTYLIAREHGRLLNFKPRFVVEGGTLRLVPIPELSVEKLGLLNGRVGELFNHEVFLPDNNIGPVTLQFPYTWTVLKLLMHERVRSRVTGRASWNRFLAPEHISNALQVTLGITQKFYEECRVRGKKCFTLFYPTPTSYNHYVKSGEIAIGTLSSEMDRLNLPNLVLSPFIRNRLGQRDICELVTSPAKCTGHFNAEGNRIISEIVKTYITQNSLL
jgi:hypothetical protein